MADATSSSTDTGSAPKAGDGFNTPKAIIKNVDMTEEMQQESVDIASAALEKYNIEKDIAAQIKKEFDKRHGPTWHAVVGKNFGSYVTHGACSLTFSLCTLDLTFSRRRNKTFHLFLRRLTRNSHLEIIGLSSRTLCISPLFEFHLVSYCNSSAAPASANSFLSPLLSAHTIDQ